MIKIKIEILDYIIDWCSARAMDGRLSQLQRNKMLNLGKQLTNAKTKLLSKKFKDDLKRIEDTSKKLQKVNRKLGNAKRKLQKIADSVNDITSATTMLEKVIELLISLKK